jgi:hypothetical protein
MSTHQFVSALELQRRTSTNPNRSRLGGVTNARTRVPAVMRGMAPQAPEGSNSAVLAALASQVDTLLVQDAWMYSDKSSFPLPAGIFLPRK